LWFCFTVPKSRWGKRGFLIKVRKPNQLFLYSGVGKPPVLKLLIGVSIVVIALALGLPSYYRSHTVEPETSLEG
jgi:hypothetical protein